MLQRSWKILEDFTAKRWKANCSTDVCVPKRKKKKWYELGPIRRGNTQSTGNVLLICFGKWRLF